MKLDEVNLEGKTAIFFDDIIDSGGSIIEGVHALRKFGVKNFYACCAHPIFSGNAKERLLNEGITVVTTDSIHIDEKEKYPNIKVVSVGFLLAEAIYSIFKGNSISQNLYDYGGYKKLVEKDRV